MVKLLAGRLGDWKNSTKSLKPWLNSPRPLVGKDIYKSAPPSYWRRFVGVSAQAWSGLDSPNPAGTSERAVQKARASHYAYFYTVYGCTPDQFRPGMSRRLYLAKLVQRRSEWFAYFEAVADKDTDLAFRWLRQTLTPRFRNFQNGFATTARDYIRYVHDYLLKRARAEHVEVGQAALADFRSSIVILETLVKMSESVGAGRSRYLGEIEEIKRAFLR